MERYHTLYKKNMPMPREAIKREKINTRANQRQDRMDRGRNVSGTSPLRSKGQGKENRTPQHLQPITDKMVVDRLIVTDDDPDKVSRKRDFLLRFIKWKEEKKAKEVVKKPRPFLPVGIATASTASQPAAASKMTTTSSFAPINHKFCPPENLRNAEKRQSLYMVLSTPKKKPAITKAPLQRIKLNAAASLAATPATLYTERNARAAPLKPAATISKVAVPTTGGAIAKAKLMQRQRNVQLRVPPKNVKVTANFKAKTSSSTATTCQQRRGFGDKLTLDCQATLSVPPQVVIETPASFAATFNPCEAIVTSTTLKNKSQSASQSGQELQDLFDTITPIEPATVQCVSKLNFNFIVNSENQQQKEATGTGNGAEANDNAMLKRKGPSLDQTSTAETTIAALTTKAQSPPTTPTRDGCAERPLNYLSPFVTVARGKVNARAEREKRNSIYLTDAGKGGSGGTVESEMAVEVRRTLAAVEYYRQRLRREMKRLEDECVCWTEYKMENVALLQETGGDDMINATIGQTRLLVTKKLMQFSGLIDRCEASATGIGASVDDGSEDKKKVNSVDLEGFWCMVELQVDNIDKRFDNLKRWKSNDWCDPDAQRDKSQSQPKWKPLTNKVMKRKAPVCKTRPQGSMIKMMKKLYAENCKKKADAAAAAASVVATTSQHSIRGSVSGSPNRPSKMLFVRDRRSFSLTPTILTIKARRSRSSMLENSPKEPKPSKDDNKELRRTAILRNCNITPPTTAAETLHGRKSILKTPGSAKGKSKNVFFSTKLASHNFNFIFDYDKGEGKDKDDDIESHD